MNYVVEVSYQDYEDVDTNDLYGPFRSEVAAERYAEQVRAAIPGTDDLAELNCNVVVSVRRCRQPFVRPARAEIREFLSNMVVD